MSIFSRIFQRKPRYQVSAYRTIYAALVERLTRNGVNVGSTAGYPRVEIHSIREQERLDKDGALRQINLIVESVSDKSLAQAVTMNEDNLRLLTEDDPNFGDDWICVGILPVQLQDLTETTDSKKILYRQLQEVTIFAERIKTEDTDTENA